MNKQYKQFNFFGSVVVIAESQKAAERQLLKVMTKNAIGCSFSLSPPQAPVSGFDEWWEEFSVEHFQVDNGFDEVDVIAKAAWQAALATQPQSSLHELAGKWQPIETAPKDGTRIDIWTEWESKGGKQGKRIPNCYWHKKASAWKTNCYEKDGWCHWRGENPTYWMPLPAPPQEGE